MYYNQTLNGASSTLSDHERQFIEDRAQGCLLGQFIGDSMGSYLEFSNYKIDASHVQFALTMPGGGIFKLLPGQLTDDGELTIMQANGITTCSSNSDIDAFIISIMFQYVEWMNSSPFDFGGTMQKSWNPFLFKDLGGVPPQDYPKLVETLKNNVKKVSADSQSNGFLMKQAPLGIFLFNQPTEVIFEFATQDTLLTHCHSFCVEVSKIYIYIISQLIKRGINDSFKIYCEVRKMSWDSQFTQQTRDTFTEVENLYDGVVQKDFLSGQKTNIYQRKSDPIPQNKSIGWVKYAFTYSLMALICPPKDFNEFCFMVLIQGGDTDTNLCISLSVVGAMYGLKFFPNDIVNKVFKCDPSKNDQQMRNVKYKPSQFQLIANNLLNKALNCQFQLKSISSSNSNGVSKSANAMEVEKNSNNSNQKSVPTQAINGDEYKDKKNLIIIGKKINEITDCSIVSMENCEVNVMKNCYVRELTNSKIGRILQSRVGNVQQSQITTLENCLIGSNETKFSYHKVQVTQIINSLFQQDID